MGDVEEYVKVKHFLGFEFEGEFNPDRLTLILQAAKAELQKSESGQTSTYDHITNLIRKILTERPDNTYGNFENLSRDSKRDAFKVSDKVTVGPWFTAQNHPAESRVS